VTAAILDPVRSWVIDVDGCLVRTDRAGGAGGVAMPGAAELLELLHGRGDRVIVCTNASEKPPWEYADHLRGLGLKVCDDEFVTAGSAAADHIAHHHAGAAVLVVGDEGVRDPLVRRGVRVVEPGGDLANVVVVGASRSYSSALLSAASLAVDAGAPLYTTVDVPWFHGGRGKSLAVSSAIAMAIGWAADTTPRVLGKPSRFLAETLMRRLGTTPETTAVVGDATVEVELARHMRATSVLVLSGATSAAAVPTLNESHRPDLALDDVGELYRALTSGGSS
jgi:HAD superfamily hydrolase (TIGR01450 family)